MSAALRHAVEWYLRTRWTWWLAGLALAVGAFIVVAGIPGIDDLTRYRIDVDVYRIGGQMILEDRPLYGPIPQTEIGVDLPFTYPPIAAVLFAPLGLVPLGWASFLLSCTSVVALIAVIHLVARDVVGLRPDAAWPLTIFASAFLVWLDPFRQTLDFGQINAILMVLVVIDVVAGRDKWWRGAGTGLAIAIKLTPAVFLAFFLVRREWRAMAVTVGSFLLATGIGFAVRPSDSWRYWTDVLPNTSRIGDPGYTSNMSLNGVIHRIAGDDVSRIWWFLGCAVVGLFVLALIHRLGDDEVTGMTVMGLYALFASPISWSHHWVWFAPTAMLMVALVLRGRGGWAPWVWLIVGVLTLRYGPQWTEPYEGDAGYHWSWHQHLWGNAWFWLLLGAYAIFWVTARQTKGLTAGSANLRTA